MKVCLFTDSFFPYMSGVTNAVVNQARMLSERGHEILIFYPATKSRVDVGALFSGNVRLETLKFSIPAPKYKGLNIAVPTIVRTTRIIKEFNPNIIHAHTEFGAGWEALICSKLLKIPIVGTFHTFFADPEYLKSVNAPDAEILQRVVWSYSVSYLNQCKRVIAPSRFTLKALKKHGLKRKSCVISNGIHLPKLLDDDKIVRLRKRYGIENSYNLIYVGRISSEKSLEIAIQAFRIVLIEHPNTRFIIVGTGPHFEELKRRIKALGIDGPVILTGRIENKEIMEDNLLRVGDVFLTASKTENQPLSVMEAMAFGLPIVAVREKGIPELVIQGYNGYLSNPDDAVEMAKYLILLMNDKDKRSTMSRNSFEEIKKHDIHLTCDMLEKLYSEAIKEKKESKPVTNLKSRALIRIRNINNKIKELRSKWNTSITKE